MFLKYFAEYIGEGKLVDNSQDQMTLWLI